MKRLHPLLRWTWRDEQHVMTLEFDRASGLPCGYCLACPLCGRRQLLHTEVIDARRTPRFQLAVSVALRPSMQPAIRCPDCHWTVSLHDGIAQPLPTRLTS